MQGRGFESSDDGLSIVGLASRRGGGGVTRGVGGVTRTVRTVVTPSDVVRRVESSTTSSGGADNLQWDEGGQGGTSSVRRTVTNQGTPGQTGYSSRTVKTTTSRSGGGIGSSSGVGVGGGGAGSGFSRDSLNMDDLLMPRDVSPGGSTGGRSSTVTRTTITRDKDGLRVEKSSDEPQQGDENWQDEQWEQGVGWTTRRGSSRGTDVRIQRGVDVSPSSDIHSSISRFVFNNILR